MPKKQNTTYTNHQGTQWGSHAHWSPQCNTCNTAIQRATHAVQYAHSVFHTHSATQCNAAQWASLVGRGFLTVEH